MKEELPLVSVVTPSYNKGAFIEETILSVKNQTYPRIEHIIIDGGSTDNTIDVIKKYEGTYNMHWVSEPDNGQSDAVNKGWRMARGEILGWLNSDDTYMPWAVETAVKFLTGHPNVSVVYGNCNIINVIIRIRYCSIIVPPHQTSYIIISRNRPCSVGVGDGGVIAIISH